MIVVDYLRGAELDNTTFAWLQPDGETLFPFSSGYTFTVEVGVLAGNMSWLTKTAGITGYDTDPNVAISWADGELDVVPAGSWVCRLTANRTFDDKDYRMLFMLRVSELELSIAERPCGCWPATVPCVFPEDMGVATRNQALLVSSQVLWALSGRRFGTCLTTVRPADRTQCRAGLPIDMWWGAGGPSAWPAGWGWPYGRFWALDTHGAEPDRIRLPHRRVSQVHEVVVDGVPLDPDAYRVDDWKWLVRLDGGEWPKTQDWAAEFYDPGVFSVTYSYGRAVPQAGLLAAGFLACEIGKLMLRQPCELPMRIQSASQGGMNVAFMDPMDFIDKGRTGIYIVDLFLKTYNPDKLKGRSRVFRADARATGRRTRTS